MNTIVRAWKDEAYRQSLSAEEQVILPANPAGEIELGDAELKAVYGAWGQDNDDSNQINQQAVATFGNSISGSVVSGSAHNSYSAYNNKKQSASSVQTCSIR